MVVAQAFQRSFSPSLRFRFGLLLLGALPAAAATFEDRVELYFRPPLAEQMALAPDGQHVAYTLQAGKELRVIVFDVDRPAQKTTLIVDEARGVEFSAEKQRAELRFLRWATADRLVMSPTEEVIKLIGGPKIIAPIMAVNADGTKPQTLLEADEFSVSSTSVPSISENTPPALPQFTARGPRIMGFAPGNREQLVVRVPPGGGMPAELLFIDVRTGKRTEQDAEGPHVPAYNDGRFPLSPRERMDLVRELEGKFPGRAVELLDWSPDLQHALARVTGGADRGRVFVFQRRFNLLLEVFRVAPWLKSGDLHETRAVDLEPGPGPRLGGWITWPRVPRLKPPPLLVIFPTGFPGYPQAHYDPEAQSLAELGFAVLRLNHRYQRGLPADRGTIPIEIDRLSIDDAAAMIAETARRFPDRPFDAKHVAALGRGFGGYLVVRAMQLRPELFRAGIAIDAPMNLDWWMNPADHLIEAPRPRELPPGIWSREELRELSVSRQSLPQPIFLLVEPARNRAIEMGVSDVRSQLSRQKRPADYFEVDPGFALGLPKARAATYRKIEEFLNLRLYDYRVKIGPATEVK